MMTPVRVFFAVSFYPSHHSRLRSLIARHRLLGHPPLLIVWHATHIAAGAASPAVRMLIDLFNQDE
jgi:hypothetical protein